MSHSCKKRRLNINSTLSFREGTQACWQGIAPKSRPLGTYPSALQGDISTVGAISWRSTELQTVLLTVLYFASSQVAYSECFPCLKGLALFLKYVYVIVRKRLLITNIKVILLKKKSFLYLVFNFQCALTLFRALYH